MRLVKMENGIPKRENFKLVSYFKEFMAMNVEVAKVELDEGDYKNIYTAKNTLNKSAKTHCFPIKPKIVNGELYLVRTDM